MLDNAVRRCGAYTSVVSTLMRYGKMNRTDACKYLIAHYPDVRAGVFVWTRLGITPDFDVFLNNNYSRTDMVYLMLKTHLRNETATQRLYELVRKVITDASTVATVFARNVYIMKATGSTLSYFNGQKIVMKRKTQMRKLLALVDDVEFESIHVEIKCSYSYRTNCGIFNPVTGVFESNGPSLNEFVYRQFTASLMEQSSLLNFKPALFKFALDCYLKVPAYIRHVEATVPVIVLVSPLWPVYNQYPNFKRYQSMPIRNFAIADFQTLLADLNRTLHYPWPEDLCDRVESMISSNTELGMLILNCLGALYTLAQYATIDPLDVAHIVVSLFGQAPHSYIGIPEWKTDDEYNVIIKSSSSLSSKRQQSGGSGSGGVNEDGDSHSLIIMRQMNETLVKETDRLPMAMSLTFRSLNVQTSVAITALFRKIGFQGLDQDVDVDVVVETMITKDHDNNNSKNNANPTTSVRMDLSRYEYVKCAILLAAWFTRMGERHVLNDSPLFMYVNAKRPTLYAQLVEFANGLGNVTVVNNQCELTDHFLSFLESTEYDARDTIQYPATFDVGDLLRSHAASASNAQLIGDVSALVDHSPAPTAGEKRKLASAVVHLLRSGSFQYDYFVELCKIIAYLEYLGNPLQLGYNFYGSSSSGKSFFTELLDRVFATGSNTILSLRTFHKSKPTENDIVQLGTNFLVRVNGDDEHLDVKAFKKYVDFNYVTRDHIQKNMNIKYAIRAKTFFISNRCVQVNKPFDSGFCNRYYPIMFDFDFVYVHVHLDRLIKHSSALNMYTTKYLGGQILMQRYPAGSMSSLDTEIAVLSRQFLTRFFFFNMVHPISPKKTGLVECLHSRYLDGTNPIQYFYKTVEIIPTNRGIDESRVREILLSWWKKHKNNFARIKDFGYIMNIIVNYLDRYRVGKRYNLEFVMLK